MVRTQVSVQCSADDLVLVKKHTGFKQNMDYMGNDFRLENNYNLYQCWKQNNSITIKNVKDDISEIIPSTISKRLENVCWRRWSKNLYKLDVSLPQYINWLKDEDVTWLYGPMFNGDEDFGISEDTYLTESNLKLMKGLRSEVTADSGDDESLVSTEPSDTSSISFNTSDSESVDFDYYDDISGLKSALKCKGVSQCNDKSVRFNYIVNSREYFNGMSIDYDFLDEQCL